MSESITQQVDPELRHSTSISVHPAVHQYHRKNLKISFRKSILFNCTTEHSLCKITKVEIADDRVFQAQAPVVKDGDAVFRVVC